MPQLSVQRRRDLRCAPSATDRLTFDGFPCQEPFSQIKTPPRPTSRHIKTTSFAQGKMHQLWPRSCPRVETLSGKLGGNQCWYVGRLLQCPTSVLISSEAKS